MQIQITGKNVDIGEAMREQILARLDGDVGKYFDGTASGHVTVMRDGPMFRADCTVRLSSGMTLQAHGQASEAQGAFDNAAERMEKRLRRYKRRLKDHHTKRGGPVPVNEAPAYVIASAEDDAIEPEGLAPAIIAEETAAIADLTVGEAVMQLDLSDQPFVFFTNAGHGGLNVVYRRPDGNIGWIDPVPTASRDKS